LEGVEEFEKFCNLEQAENLQPPKDTLCHSLSPTAELNYACHCGRLIKNDAKQNSPGDEPGLSSFITLSIAIFLIFETNQGHTPATR
jgi:hypothetical protein